MEKYSLCFLLFMFLTFLGSCSFYKNTPSFTAPEMVFLEGGTFRMGDIIDSINTDALPIHEISLGDFYIGKYEVTFEQYDEFALETGRSLPHDDRYGRGKRAVVRVDWNDARAFCNYFGWRLPTENEWEYAARSEGQRYLFSGTNESDSLSEYAITSDENIPFTFPVGSRKPNRAGIFDMSGNAYEWIGNYYQFYEHPDEWHDIENSSVRIIRGGSFRDWKSTAKTYWRVGVLAETEYYDIGFRCAVTQQELDKHRFPWGILHSKPAKP